MLLRIISMTAILLPQLILAQQTVGLFQNDARSFNGYTLFAPTGYEHTYLIDNCGQLVHEWTSNFTPGQSAYLLENGDLLRTARISSAFTGGGSGGRIERINWEDELVWHVNYSTINYHQHHDIEPLPNGNVLVIAWERRSMQEAIDAGRDPALLTSGGMWPERIVELQPVGEDDYVVAWEWHAWDHLVQDFDSTRANFGMVAQHPELIDVNHIGDNGIGADWIHCNSVDYNPALDQILLSSRHFNEIWIIDHSTTTAEAAGHSGGISGKGGDLLYRWGNPEVYRQGTSNTQTLYGQHDAHWIEAGLPDAGKIMVFNNGFGRPEGTFSSIDIIVPPMDSNDRYILEPGTAYGPDTAQWSFDGRPDADFFSSRISSGQRLSNGNTLICVGTSGYFFEVDTNGTIVWRYGNPVGLNGPVAQGESVILEDVFKVQRYAPTYPAFDGQDLTPGVPVETNPWPSDCMIYPDTTTSTPEVLTDPQWRIAPNPFSEQVIVDGAAYVRVHLMIHSVAGRLIYRERSVTLPVSIGARDWPDGLYIVHLITNNRSTSLKMIKQ